MASSFWRSCNLDAKTTKNLLRQKLKGEDMLLLEKVKSSEVSEFSILPYTQNREVGNLESVALLQILTGVAT